MRTTSAAPWSMPILAALALPGLLAWAPQAAARRLQLADLTSEVGFGFNSLTLSPDGRYVAVATQRTDLVDNRYTHSLAIVDTGNGTVREFTPGRHQVSVPQWSPDGGRIAWLDAELAGAAQVYVASLEPGARHECVTDAAEGVELYKWSPDGRSIAYIAAESPAARTGAERFNRSFEAGDGDYLATAPRLPSHLWIKPLDGAARRVTSGTESVRALEWLRDGHSIALVTQPTAKHTDYLDQSLVVLDLASGQRRVLVSEHRAVAMNNPPTLSPDGALMAFSRVLGPGRDSDYYPDSVSVIAVKGGAHRMAAPTIDRQLLDMAWLPDSRGMLVGGPDRTRYGVWVQPLDGAPRRLDIGPVAKIWDLSVSRSGGLAFMGSESHHPAEVYFTPSLRERPKRLTHFNDHLAALDAGRIETVRWTSDGFEHDGVLIYPPDFKPGTKYPLVLNIHGGPSEPATESWHWGEDGFNRVLAAQGWVVFLPNYRGSGSMGLAYQSAIVNDACEGPGRDLMAGLAAVKSRGFVDESRIALTGYSYGGMMTVWLAAHHQGWRVAVAGAAVTDNFDWYNLADYNVAWGLGMNGSPWLNDNAANYWRQSPIAYAHQIRTPMLILSGTHDRRVSVTQSYKLYHALKDNGVPVRFIAYPDNPHWPADPVHERDLFRRWIDWIETHFHDPA